LIFEANADIVAELQDLSGRYAGLIKRRVQKQREDCKHIYFNQVVLETIYDETIASSSIPRPIMGALL
jgi:hypothetical protein